MYPQRTAREISEQVTNSGTVHIRLLGPDARHWALQKNLLRYHSPYFRDRLSPNTLDETLDDLEVLQAASHLISAEPFELLVQWLYTGGIDAVKPPTASNSLAAQLDVLIRLHCLCAPAYLDMPVLQTLAVTRMRDLYTLHGASFSEHHVRFIYTHTPPGSPLRQIALQAAVHDFMAPEPFASQEPVSSTGTSTGTSTTISPSYAFMTSSVDFATDLLHLIRAHVGARPLPHPFLDPCPASGLNPTSPHLTPLPPSRPITPSPSQSPSPHLPSCLPTLPSPPSGSAPDVSVPVAGLLTPDLTPKKECNGESEERV